MTSTLFQGGGDMGRRIREYNWAATPVGPIETWPSSLRNAVNIVLSSRFPMFIWWGPGLIQFYNDAYRPSMGDTGKHPAALGQRGEDCWPEIWPVIYPLIRQVLDTGEATWSEDQLIPIYRNGGLEDVYWTFGYSPIIDDDGKIGGVLVVCSENTEKVLNYRKLLESEDKLSFAIEAAELGTWDYNPLTGKFTANRRLKDWFGLAPGEEIELTAAIEGVIANDRQRVVAAIERVLRFESGGYYDIKYGIRDKVSGRERFVRAKGRAWFNEEDVAYRFNGTLQDITEQETIQRALEQAEVRTRLAIESAELGTYELNLQTEEFVTSDRFNAIWGIASGATHEEVLALVHRDDHDARAQAFEEALRSGYIDYITRVNLPAGGERWVRVKGVVTYDQSGSPLTLIGITQDITGQKKIEDTLTREVASRTRELQRSNEDLLQFAHVISHDLKEPVRKVKIYSSRMEDELPEQLGEKGHKYLGKIQNCARRMMAMIEGVLNYADVTSAPQEPERIDLNEVLRQICEDLEVPIQQKGAVVSYGRLPDVYGVPILIYQLFYNLVNNSLKFTRDGVAPVIRVTASALRPASGAAASAASATGASATGAASASGAASATGAASPAASPRDLLEIVITDNGIGFQEEHARAIFDNFTRLHSKDIFEGSGLGLALAKKIVERHGGTISASSAPGEGAAFVLTLPLA